MNRNKTIEKLGDASCWDVIVIGGGATGLGAAVDAASRGFKTLVLEQADFAKGTSSRSTKLVHGGVRYLEQGNVKLVLEALHERGLFLKNAPQLAKKQAFIIPVYSLWEKLKYLTGLKLYDWMARDERIGNSVWLSEQKVLRQMPGVKEDRLKGGVLYFDGQFDDARMALALAETVEDQGGAVLNYFSVRSLLKDKDGKINGVVAKDGETGNEYHLKCRSVINATGVFVDEIYKMDTHEEIHSVQPSQGIHLVLPPRFLETKDFALMIPKTDDGRVLFLVPWHEHLLMGTTDTALEEHTLEPRALEEEINFILRNASQYLKQAPARKDVLSVFAGLRPLALPPKDSGKSSKDISRHHKVMVGESGLVTVIGGKWTTYRKMGEDAIDKLIEVSGLSDRPSQTKELRIHGWKKIKNGEEWDVYGSDREKIDELIAENPELGRKLNENWPQTRAEVVWAVKEEMARKVEDVLSRRMRILFLDARVAAEMAPEVAEIMKNLLQRDDGWKEKEIREFRALAQGYSLTKLDKK